MQIRLRLITSVSRGFTVVEVIVVVGIITILMSLLLTAVQSAREASRKVVCNNNIRNLALATQVFESAQRIYPVCRLNAAPNSPAYRRDTSLFRQLLPFLEQNAISNAWDDSEFSFGPRNASLASQRLSILNCPSSPADKVLESGAIKFGAGPSIGLDIWHADYAGNGFADNRNLDDQSARGMFGVAIETFYLESIKHSDVLDGHSTTILYWESFGGAFFRRNGNVLLQSSFDTYPAMGLILVARDHSGVAHAFPFSTVATIKSYLGAWAGLRVAGLANQDVKAINWENRGMEPFSMHSGSCTFAFVDGRVQNLSEQIERKVLVGLCTRNGNEVVLPE